MTDKEVLKWSLLFVGATKPTIDKYIRRLEAEVRQQTLREAAEACTKVDKILAFSTMYGPHEGIEMCRRAILAMMEKK